MLEDVLAFLTQFGLQQTILDMYFIRKISNTRCSSSKHIIHSVSSIITCAISVFATRGVDLKSTLPENEWFIDND